METQDGDDKKRDNRTITGLNESSKESNNNPQNNLKILPSPPESKYPPMPAFQKNLHSLFSLLFSDSSKRLNERNGFALKFELKYDNGEIKSYYMINLYYQLCVGAIGGVTCGIESNEFHGGPLSTTLIGGSQSKSIVISKFTGLQNFLQNTSIVGSVTTRAILGGLLFNVLDKNMEQYRQKKDWINFASAGLVSGAMFGLTGGIRGSVIGSLGFGGFAAMAGFFDDFFKQHF